MTDVPRARSLPREEVERMLALVRPDWTLREASLAADGVTPVYHLRVADARGRERECVLKAARPADDQHLGAGDVAAEARLLAIVREHTSTPVPAVLGAVDAHDGVRTPFFLMEKLGGTELPARDLVSLSEPTLRRVARQSGRYLGELHGVGFDRVTAFGRGITCERSPPLRGERPTGDPDQLVLRDGADDFRDLLCDWWDQDLDGLAETAVADLLPAIRRTLHDSLAAVPANQSPTVARLDHGWHNLLVGSDADELVGVLDWGTLAAFPPAYDLALVELRLAGGPRLALPDAPDRRSLVRDAMLEGYREERPLPTAYRRQRRCYQLDVLQSWLQSLGNASEERAVPSERADEAADGFRALVEALLD